MSTTRFEFRFDTSVLAVLGIRPATTGVEVSDMHLDVRFGPWGCKTPLSNVCDVQVTRDYVAIKAIGPRASAKDRGATFGTSTVGGVCICFKKPVKALTPIAWNTALTVTVEDIEGLAALIRERCGLDS